MQGLGFRALERGGGQRILEGLFFDGSVGIGCFIGVWRVLEGFHIVL